MTLADSATSLRFIETLPKKGYRFIGEIRSPEARADSIGKNTDSRAKATNSRRLIWIVTAVMVAIGIAVTCAFFFSRWKATGNATTGITSLAVLPIENLLGDPEQEFFADGMTDELITMIAKTAPLRVISRTSVMSYKGARARKTVREIARELNADAIVEGSMTRAGSKAVLSPSAISMLVPVFINFRQKIAKSCNSCKTLQYY